VSGSSYKAEKITFYKKNFSIPKKFYYICREIFPEALENILKIF
jgi:hypothetical protein